MSEASGSQQDYKALGAALESAGWQQFSFVKEIDVIEVLREAHQQYEALRWVVISHSCDLIHHTDQEREIELLGLEPLGVVPPDEFAKQSPRMRIVAAYLNGGPEPSYFRARPYKRLTVARDRLSGKTPDDAISLRSQLDPQGLRGRSEREIADWLASRYNRAWTPSEFDRRLKRNVGKIQPSLQRLHAHGVEEIFIRVTPTEELTASECYEVSLIVLVDPDRSNKMEAVRAEVKTLTQYLQQPGRIAVIPPPNVELSTMISYGDLRGWMKFHEVFRDSLAAAS